MRAFLLLCASLSGTWLAGGAPGAGGALPPAHPEGPPPAHTGGFGEPTCQACHTEYAVNAPGGVLTVDGIPEAWEPGAAYVLTVTLRSEEMGAAGFQLAVRDRDGRPAGLLEALDGRVAVDTATVHGVLQRYARHTRLGSAVDDPGLASWAVGWTAPASTTELRLHAAANSGNGDNSPFGDLVYTTESTTAAPTR